MFAPCKKALPRLMHHPARQKRLLKHLLKFRLKHRLKPLHPKPHRNPKCCLIRLPRAALPNLLNCRKSRLVKSVAVVKRIKNIPMPMLPAVRLLKTRQAMRQQRPINLVQRQLKCKTAGAVKLKKWHRAAQHHAAKLRVVANQVK